MNAQLYYNKSNKNVVDKSITTIGSQLTIHLKDDTDVVNPIIYISRDISNFKDANYIKINGLKNRYYYIDSYETSQQYYIVKCHVDVLMSFKDDILNQKCIVSRNSYKYNMYLQDDKLKLNNMSRTETFKFPQGFKVSGSKTATFLLTINGSGSVQ